MKNVGGGSQPGYSLFCIEELDGDVFFCQQEEWDLVVSSWHLHFNVYNSPDKQTVQSAVERPLVSLYPFEGRGPRWCHCIQG